MQATVIGIDLAKNVFQVHGVSANGEVVVQRKLRRNAVLDFFGSLDPCLVGMEACYSAHHWARELIALGHEVRLMPPSYVKPYVKRGKNDANDAAAICEAVTRPTMRFVPVKSAEQQSVLMMHRVREQLVRQRTALTNAMRSHLAEFGIIAPIGRNKVGRLIEAVEENAGALPPLLRETLQIMQQQLEDLSARIEDLEKKIFAWGKENAAARRLATVPGIGPLTAAALAATITDPGHFRSAREFAAWIGLVPRQNSSGGKERLGGISKMGDRYLRKLLSIGASSIIRYAQQRGGLRREWVLGLLDRRPRRVVQTAIANKIARLAWVVLARGEVYRSQSGGAV